MNPFKEEKLPPAQLDPVDTQRMQALAKANEQRSLTAALKRRMKAATLDACELVEQASDPDAEHYQALKTATAHDFLTWIPWIGKHKANAILRKSHIPHSFLVRDLPLTSQVILVKYMTAAINSPHRTYRSRPVVAAAVDTVPAAA